MVTLPAGFVVDLNNVGEGTTAVGIRRALAALVKQSAPGVAISGRLDSDHFVVKGSSSSMAYTVTGGGLVLSRNAPNGAYIVGSHQTVTVPTAAAGGVNPRIDRIYALQPDPGIDGDGVGPDLIIDVAIGTPGANPAVPAIPSGALELARKRVGATATNTAAGDAFTNIAPVTGLNVEIPKIVPVSVDQEANNGGAIINPNTNSTILTVTVPGTFAAGTVVELFASVELNGYTNAAIGGQVRFYTESGALIKSRRWHNRGRAMPVFPSLQTTHVFQAAATNPKFSLRVSSDPSSGGPIELWDTYMHVRADRITF